ncbi:alpha/beta hydrolase [Chloroflexota bacterium]
MRDFIDQQLFAHVPEMREFNKSLAGMISVPSATNTNPVERIKAARESISFFILETVAEAQDRVIQGPAGDLPIRILIPPTVDAVYLDIHGGGWVMGSPVMDDASNWAIANVANVAVVSVDYRLAPEHPFPAGPDDCESAALWLLENAVAEFGSDRILVGGGSAGAHLAVETLIRLRDRHKAIHRVIGANLMFGVYDLGMTPSQCNAGDRFPILRTSDLEFCYEMYLPGIDIEARRNPKYSPLYADLSNLPPALFTVGTHDMLLDDSLFMASRWEIAGNQTELAVYPESPHGFPMFPTAMARAANHRIEDFLRRIIGCE